MSPSSIELPPGEACSFGNAGVFANYGCLPVSVPGLAWSVPGMLFDPAGALTIRLGYWLTLFPWLVKFLRAGRMDRMQVVGPCTESSGQRQSGTAP